MNNSYFVAGLMGTLAKVLFYWVFQFSLIWAMLKSNFM